MPFGSCEGQTKKTSCLLSATSQSSPPQHHVAYRPVHLGDSCDDGWNLKADQEFFFLHGDCRLAKTAFFSHQVSGKESHGQLGIIISDANFYFCSARAGTITDLRWLAFILTGKSNNNYYRFRSPRQAANMSVLMFNWSTSYYFVDCTRTIILLFYQLLHFFPSSDDCWQCTSKLHNNNSNKK